MKSTREKNTITVMIGMFCRAHHQRSEHPCLECRTLRDYAFNRIEACPMIESKTTCARCPVHCYTPEMRKKIVKVMRYAGPRMMLHHPVLTLLHLLDRLS